MIREKTNNRTERSCNTLIKWKYRSLSMTELILKPNDERIRGKLLLNGLEIFRGRLLFALLAGMFYFAFQVPGRETTQE